MRPSQVWALVWFGRGGTNSTLDAKHELLHLQCKRQEGAVRRGERENARRNRNTSKTSSTYKKENSKLIAFARAKKVGLKRKEVELKIFTE
jgi:hypothetical protein